MTNIFDAIGDVIGNAHDRSKARKFAQGVKVGDTLFAKQDFALPTGDTTLLVEHKFTKKCRWTGMAMCGHRTVDAVWLDHNGELYRTRPPGYQTLDEYSASGSWDLPGASQEVAARVAQQVKAELRKLAAASR